MATLGVQQQRIPLVDPQTGMITKEWLKILGGAAAGTAVDVSALSDALDAAMVRIATLEAQIAALATRLQALESAQGDEFVLQGAAVSERLSETLLQPADKPVLSDALLQPAAQPGLAEVLLQPAGTTDFMSEMVMQP